MPTLSGRAVCCQLGDRNDRLEELMHALILLAALTCESGNAARLETSVFDCCEVNHFFDEHGRHVFDQFIAWTWNDESCCYDCDGWKLINRAGMVPVKRGRFHESVWFDGERLRRVRCRTVRQTWTQHDPELFERTKLPVENRRGF